MAKKSFHQSLGYKLLEVIEKAVRLVPLVPVVESYDDWYERISGESIPSIHRIVYNLEKEDLIKREKRGKKLIFKITPKGKRKLLIGKVLNNLIKEKDKKWDGKWRIIIFDVPETKKSMREFLRKELYMNNFYMLQKSVWITPFKISDDFGELLKVIGLDYHVRYIVAESINYERDLFRHFKFYINY